MKERAGNQSQEDRDLQFLVFLNWTIRTDIPLAKAKVSRDAATIRMEQLQILEIQMNVRRAMLPLSPRLLNTIWAKGCPSGEVTRLIASWPIQNAIVMISAHPVTAPVTRDETIANGTAFAAFEASSAIVAEDSKPDTTQTGVKNDSMKAHPLKAVRGYTARFTTVILTCPAKTQYSRNQRRHSWRCSSTRWVYRLPTQLW